MGLHCFGNFYNNAAEKEIALLTFSYVIYTMS